MSKKIETTVNVTLNDIKHGERAKCDSCPVALALKRLFPDAVVGVCSQFADVLPSPRSRTLRADMPDRAATFVRSFDRRKRVTPIRFSLTFKRLALSPPF